MFEVSAVGLRNMLPMRFGKVKNPYIEFDLVRRLSLSVIARWLLWAEAFPL